VEHGVVFDRRADRDAGVAGDGAEHRHVVALGAAAGEDHFVRVAAGHSRDDVAGLVDRLARLSSEAVRARRVGVLLGEVRQHRLDRLGAHGRRRRMVQVGDGGVGHPPHATDDVRP
jgi:hypothetical protein